MRFAARPPSVTGVLLLTALAPALAVRPVSAARPLIQNQTASDTIRITLQEAALRSQSVSPAMITARGSVAAARGAHAGAVLPFSSNPRVEYERRRRRDPGVGDEYDYQWTLSQSLEIGGQSFLRSSQTGQRVGAAQARVENAARLATRDAEMAFLAARLAIRRARLNSADDSFAVELESASRRQFDQGMIDRLAYNASVLSAARAHSRAERSLAARDQAMLELARVLGFPPDSVPWPVELPPLPRLSAGDSIILALARARRPDLAAARLGMSAAETGVGLAQRSLLPDLLLSGFTGKEEGADILGFSAGVRVPLFHRRQRTVGLAVAERESARASLAETMRRVQAEALGAAARYRTVSRAAQGFEEIALRSAHENLELSERSLRAGEISVTDLIVLRSQAIGAELAYLDILRDAYVAWFDLTASLNTTPGQLLGLLSDG